jgi:hypothetical protein
MKYVSTPRLTSRGVYGVFKIIGVNQRWPSNVKAGARTRRLPRKYRFHRLCVVVIVFLPEKYV